MGVQLQPKLKTMEKNEYGRGTQSCLIDKAGEAEYLHSLQGQIEKANVNAFSYLTRQMFIELRKRQTGWVPSNKDLDQTNVYRSDPALCFIMTEKPLLRNNKN